MIIIRAKHILRAPAGEADGGGGLNLQADPDDVNDGGGSADGDDDGGDAGPVDRGDELEPALNPAALAKVAAGAEDDGDDDAAAAAAAGKKPAPNRVPIARLNEVIEQRDALKAENEALKSGKAAPGATPAPTEAPVPAFDVNKAEREYAELLAEGEFDKAVELRGKINQVLIDTAEANVENRQAARAVQSTVTEVANQAVADYPYLDSEEGAEVLEMITAARDRSVRAGVDPAAALKAAVDKIAPKFAPDDGNGTPGKKLPAAPARVDTRPQGANARGAAASTSQPAPMGGAGNRLAAGRIDVEDLTEAQFDALTPAEKKKHRGDDV